MEQQPMDLYRITTNNPAQPYISYNDPRRVSMLEEHQIKIRNIFFSVVNKIVSLGGVVCLTKQQLETDYLMLEGNFDAQLSLAAVEQLKKMSEIKSCVKLKVKN